MKKVGVNFRKVLQTRRILGMAPTAVLCIIFGVFASECFGGAAAEDQGGYFLFAPPFGGDRPPQEVVANKRSGAGDGNDVAPIARAVNVAPAETLWVGSHKINWSPLPFFQKFLDNHQQKQHHRLAQARKFDVQTQQQDINNQAPPFSIPGGSFKENFEHQNIFPQHQPHHHNKINVFQNPHHDYSNKFAPGGFFAGLSAAFGKTNAPSVLVAPKFAEPRSSIQPETDFAPVPHTFPQGSHPTTPLPSIQVSTGGSILVSPPEAIRALSTPGPSLSPIIDRLRQMTEWSKQSQKTGLVHKEGKPDSHRERKLRLKKRLRPAEAKGHKHNIEAIILANDEDDFNASLSLERNDNNQEIIMGTKTKKSLLSRPKKKSKAKKKGGRSSTEHTNNGSIEETTVDTRAIQQPHSDLIILHPTNAALLDPLEGQQTSLKSYQIKRKDKKMNVFKIEDGFNRPTPVSFRFGAQDAKPNPYSN